MISARQRARKHLPPDWEQRKAQFRDRIRQQFFGQLAFWPLYAYRNDDTRRYTYD